MVVHSISRKSANDVVNGRRRSVEMMGNLSQYRPMLGATFFLSPFQSLCQTQVKKETLRESEVEKEKLSASLQAYHAGRTVKFLWCTTEKKNTINTSIKPLILDTGI